MRTQTRRTRCAYRMPVLNSGKVIADVVELVNRGFKRATAYVAPHAVIKATVRCSTRGSVEIVLTGGRPNFAERKFIKACIKAGERFPIRKIQVKECTA